MEGKLRRSSELRFARASTFAKEERGLRRKKGALPQFGGRRMKINTFLPANFCDGLSAKQGLGNTRDKTTSTPAQREAPK